MSSSNCWKNIFPEIRFERVLRFILSWCLFLFNHLITVAFSNRTSFLLYWKIAISDLFQFYDRTLLELKFFYAQEASTRHLFFFLDSMCPSNTKLSKKKGKSFLINKNEKFYDDGRILTSPPPGKISVSFSLSMTEKYIEDTDWFDFVNEWYTTSYRIIKTFPASGKVLLGIVFPGQYKIMAFFFFFQIWYPRLGRKDTMEGRN